MKGVFYEGARRLAVREIADPVPGPGEVLLRVFACGVCETDVAMYRGAISVPPGIVLGHMGGGEVIAVGSEVDHRVGDRVAVDPRVVCGECELCRGGHASLCQTRLEAGLGVFVGVDAARDADHAHPYHGLLADLCCVPARACYSLPDTLSDAHSAAVEGVAFSVRCMRAAGLRLGDNVAIFGASDFCLEWMMWARQLGARRIAVVEPIAPRRAMAEALGADLVVDPEREDVVAQIRQLMPWGPDLVGLYPCFPGAMALAQQVLRPRGHIQVLICYDDAHLHGSNPLLPVMKEIRISYPGLFEAEPERGGRARGDFALAIELLSEGRIDVDRYVTRWISWGEIDDIEPLAFARLPNHEVKVRVDMSAR